MSSWDRTRYIPWSKLPAVSSTEESYDTQKERVFRSLQKEANREKESLSHSKGEKQLKRQDDQGIVPPEIVESRKKKGLFNSGVEYETPDLLRSLAFGGCIGSITVGASRCFYHFLCGYKSFPYHTNFTSDIPKPIAGVSLWIYGWNENCI